MNMTLRQSLPPLLARCGIFGVFAIGSLLMQRAGITYHDGYVVLVVYNMVTAIALGLYFRDDLRDFLRPLDTKRKALLVLSLFGFFTLGLAANRLPIPPSVIEQYPHTFYFEFDFSFMATKISDVFFQQVFILSVLGFLVTAYTEKSQVLAAFAVLFTTLHLGMLVAAGTIAVFQIGLSLVAAVLFALMILHLRFGFLYAFLLHLGGYVALRVLVWAYYST